MNASEIVKQEAMHAYLRYLALMAIKERRQVVDPKDREDNMDRCDVCGYTEKDAQIHADHHLCKNKNPPWKAKKHEQN